MTSLKRELGGIAFVLLAASGNAHAQTLTPSDQTPGCPSESTEPSEAGAPSEPCPAPAPQQPPPAWQGAPTGAPATEPATAESWVSSVGLAISGGGGADGFTSGTMRDVTNIGGSWNVRMALGTRLYTALELSYIGSAQGVDTFAGPPTSAVLVGNGAQGALRINATTNYFLQPFIYGGAAWRHYSLTNTDIDTPRDLSSSANVFEVPAGGGIAAYFSGVMVDVRGEYRWSWGDDLMPDTSMNRWGATGNVGYEF